METKDSHLQLGHYYGLAPEEKPGLPKPSGSLSKWGWSSWECIIVNVLFLLLSRVGSVLSVWTPPTWTMQPAKWNLSIAWSSTFFMQKLLLVPRASYGLKESNLEINLTETTPIDLATKHYRIPSRLSIRFSHFCMFNPPFFVIGLWSPFSLIHQPPLSWVCMGTYSGGRSSPLSFLVSSYFALLQRPVCRVFALGHLIPSGIICNGKHIQRVRIVPYPRSVQPESGPPSTQHRVFWPIPFSLNNQNV